MHQIKKNKSHESKTLWVVILTAVTMMVEIYFGLVTKSMALLADGIHMASHVLAIGISWIAYVFVRRLNVSNQSKINTEKILSLAGFTSGILLLVFALVILVEATQRFLNPLDISYREAILVSIVGLFVNIVSAVILHHKHETSDHNLRAAYLHVIADALTSLSAIIGLSVAMVWDITYVDTIAAVISSFVIIRWSSGLLRDSGRVLLDYSSS